MNNFTKQLITSMIVTALIAFLLFQNFSSNAMYYTYNLPNPTREKLMISLVNNITHYYSYMPDGFFYLDDGENLIIIDTEPGKSAFFSTYYDNQYLYSTDDDKHYTFDKDFKLVKATLFTENEITDLQDVDEKAVIDELYSLLEPAINKSLEKKPLINLKSYFNFIFKDKENEK